MMDLVWKCSTTLRLLFGSVWLHVHCLPPQPNFPNVEYSLLYSFLSLALHWSSQELCRVLLSPTGPLNINYNRNLKSHSVTFERFPATFLTNSRWSGFKRPDIFGVIFCFFRKKTFFDHWKDVPCNGIFPKSRGNTSLLKGKPVSKKTQSLNGGFERYQRGSPGFCYRFSRVFKTHFLRFLK